MVGEAKANRRPVGGRQADGGLAAQASGEISRNPVARLGSRMSVAPSLRSRASSSSSFYRAALSRAPPLVITRIAPPPGCDGPRDHRTPLSTARPYARYPSLVPRLTADLSRLVVATAPPVRHHLPKCLHERERATGKRETEDRFSLPAVPATARLAAPVAAPATTRLARPLPLAADQFQSLLRCRRSPSCSCPSSNANSTHR